MADFTKFGERTPRVVVYKSESHKLHQAFNVKSGKTVYAGNPVVLETDGKIRAFEATDKLSAIIGYAETNSINPAYKESNGAGPIEVTVAVKGYAVINAIASGEVTAGPVKPDGSMDETKRFTKFKALAGTDPLQDVVAFISLTSGSDGDLIQVLVL